VRKTALPGRRRQCSEKRVGRVTEQEWLTGDSPWRVAGFLRQLGTDRRVVCRLAGKAMLRKVQLFVCGCCRLHWRHLADDRSRKAVEVAERHADGQAKKRELRQAQSDAEAVGRGMGTGATAVQRLAAQAAKVAGEQAWNAAASAVALAPRSLVQCVFGNPFRPPVVDPALRTRDVVALAESAYEERLLPGGRLDKARLAVLADALLCG
jgi:hypothetical protein